MEEEELKTQQETAKGSKAVMNLQKQQTQKEINAKSIASELHTISQKNQQRKISQQEIDYLVNQFCLTRNKATNILRKMDLKQAIRTLVYR